MCIAFISLISLQKVSFPCLFGWKEHLIYSLKSWGGVSSLRFILGVTGFRLSKLRFYVNRQYEFKAFLHAGQKYHNICCMTLTLVRIPDCLTNAYNPFFSQRLKSFFSILANCTLIANQRELW